MLNTKNQVSKKLYLPQVSRKVSIRRRAFLVKRHGGTSQAFGNVKGGGSRGSSPKHTERGSFGARAGRIAEGPDVQSHLQQCLLEVCDARRYRTCFRPCSASDLLTWLD